MRKHCISQGFLEETELIEGMYMYVERGLIRMAHKFLAQMAQ